jgi:hypothetical protein
MHMSVGGQENEKHKTGDKKDKSRESGQQSLKKMRSNRRTGSRERIKESRKSRSNEKRKEIKEDQESIK